MAGGIGRTHRQLTWASIALVVLLFAASGAFAVRWAATPADCAAADLTRTGLLAGSVRVLSTTGDCPLRPGDEVGAVDRRPLAELPPGGWTDLARTDGAELPAAAVRWPGGVRPDTETFGTAEGRLVRVQLPLTRPDPVAAFVPTAPTMAVMLALFALAIYLVIRRPHQPASAALLLGVGGLLASTVSWSLGLSVTAVTDPWLRWGHPVANPIIYGLGWTGMLAFALVFPRLLLPRWLTWAVVATPPLALAGTAAIGAVTALTHLHWIGLMVACGEFVAIGTLLAVLVIGVVRLRTTTDPVGRQQLRWIAGGAVLSAGLSLAGWYLPEQLLGTFLIPNQFIGLAALPGVAGIAIAVLRYRLFDLDVVLNRSLVYGLLTVTVTALYLVVLAGLTQLLQTGPVPSAALVGTAVAAVAVNPLRIGLQRGINRLMYGYRDDPYTALSRLSQRLEATAARESVLAQAAGDVRLALRLPYAEVALTGSPPVGSGTAPPTELVEVPLRHGGEQLGVLRVAPRAATEQLSTADRRLLRDLAHQISGAARVVALHTDLLRSRERLVLAREEERRRLRRVLHDEIGPSVAALGLRAATAARRPDPAVLRQIQTDAAAAASQLRELAYDLRPPVLDERGLLAAITELADPGWLAVDADGSLAGLPAAVEVAAYRIVAEAVANARRHAAAGSGTVRLQRSATALTVTVRDDGTGLPADFRAGVGVSSMRERAAELGGECTVRSVDRGTEVRAVLPIGGPA